MKLDPPEVRGSIGCLTLHVIGRRTNRHIPDVSETQGLGIPGSGLRRPRNDAAQHLLRRRPLGLGVLLEREAALDLGALADGGIERHGAAVQLDEGAHDREAEAGAAVARACEWTRTSRTRGPAPRASSRKR